ncbi:MAG: leucine-rich repeat domain-containing protein [Firmicutes bacterium]|nr:leucine-rich repeat domain-containing protein [Bacillota bacterium]
MSYYNEEQAKQDIADAENLIQSGKKNLALLEGQLNVLNTAHKIHADLENQTLAEQYFSAIKQLEDYIETIKNPENTSCKKVKQTATSPTKKAVSKDFDIFYDCLNKYKGRDEKVVVPECIREIGPGAFDGCTKIKEITFEGENLEKIWHCAFSDCKNLRKIVLPNSVKEIENMAFINCPCLKEIIIPEKVEFIGEYAFTSHYGFDTTIKVIGKRSAPPEWNEKWADVENIIWDAKVEDIYQKQMQEAELEQAFAQTSNPSDFEIDDDGVLVKYKGKSGRVIIPDYVTEIGEEAFEDSEVVRFVSIPESVWAIRDWAFQGCKNLVEVCFEGDGLEIIGFGVFSRCIDLKRIVLPSSLTFIEEKAFCECMSLESITIPPSVTQIQKKAFCDCPNLVIQILGRNSAPAGWEELWHGFIDIVWKP